jgi:excisionase family DNA binding protein
MERGHPARIECGRDARAPCNEKQVYRLVRAGKIPATRVTGKWLFPRSLVREWVAPFRFAIRLLPRQVFNFRAGESGILGYFLNRTIPLQHSKCNSGIPLNAVVDIAPSPPSICRRYGYL